ncbi:MAG TPA: tRNA (adenosine(37)-N6)-dimethylallyltransferase MiaA [Candidatus Saccharimonadales bacterium]|nr:tRNA (adenosine(37)-N6)-dimethylallyltransferase MiaA [Candidatus Saccharimonadales bacterium]
MNPHRELPLVVIVGPTASGKSTLGVWLAQQLDGEVIACDSTQLYRGFDIGTAKPTEQEKSGVPHHLLDVLDSSEETTAGAYRERAIVVLSDLHARKKLPIFTVGTGLYLRALLEGFAEVPVRSEELRERLRASAAEHGEGYLHRILQKLDPVSARKIAAADAQKLIRAIEVCLLAKQPLSRLHQTGRTRLEGWRAIKVGLNPRREDLYRRIHDRTDSMLRRGWLDEVRGLVESGVAENAKPFDFLGYRELRQVLRGDMDLQDARVSIQQATRRYAKRQGTWFRRETGVHWLEGFGDDAEIQRMALGAIRAAL